LSTQTKTRTRTTTEYVGNLYLSDEMLSMNEQSCREEIYRKHDSEDTSNIDALNVKISLHME